MAIVITTYRRADGKTPSYLKRAIDSVHQQTFKDFHLFVIGDCYDDKNEFSNLIKGYNSKMSCYNLSRAIEREKYGSGMKLWCCGGVNAINFGVCKALKNGFDYISFLDHDDYWANNHLELINELIEKRKPDWICTKSKYGLGSFLPVHESNKDIIDFKPLPGGIIKSSVCYNHRTIPLRFRNVIEETGDIIPSDADLWQRISEYITLNNLKSCFINKLTCYHLEEGHLIYGN